MCLMCAEFQKGKMTAREVGVAMREFNQQDPHLEDVAAMVMDSGEENMKALIEAVIETNSEDET